MDTNINKTTPENDVRNKAYKNGSKRKTYKSPSLTNIGLVNQVTLGGVVTPAADSGSFFSPS